MIPHQHKISVLGDDILHLITLTLDSRSLSVVCRTTKLFHSYAVRILWRSLDGITPLMKLFPNEVVSYEENKRRSVFHNVLKVDDWRRFEYYAPFVKAFSFNEQDIPWTSFPVQWAESLASRSFLMPHKRLLPSLATLEWKAETSTSLLLEFPHFIARTLDSLSITFLSNDATNALPGLSGFLESTPPPLSNLEIVLRHEADSNCRSSLETAHDIGRIIQAFPDISSLRSDRWILVYGVGASLLPKNLRKLFVDRYVAWANIPGYNDDLLIVPTEIFLPCLKHVRSHDLAWEGLSSLFLNTADRILSFDCSQPEVIMLWSSDHSQLIEAFQEMGNRCVKLTSLRLQGLAIDQPDADLTGSLLPFTQCKNLEVFDILAEADFVRFMSDDDVAQMAAAWPRLQKFVIQYSDFEESTGKDTEATDLIPFSFSSIASLVQHCPLLRTLSLSINMRNDVVLHDQIPYESPFRLDGLNLGHSIVTNVNSLAMLIRDICPAHCIQWINEERDLKVAVAGLQVIAETQRAEESTRHATELRQRVRTLVEELGELRGRSAVQIQVLTREIESLRTELDAFRSGPALVQRSEDLKPSLKAE